MRILVVLVVVFASPSAFAENARHPNVGIQHGQHVQNSFSPHSPQMQHPPQEHLAQVPPIPPQAHTEPRVRVIEIAPTALCADGIYAYSADPDDFCASHSGISYYFSW